MRALEFLENFLSNIRTSFDIFLDSLDEGRHMSSTAQRTESRTRIHASSKIRTHEPLDGTAKTLNRPFYVETYSLLVVQ